jgi:MFS family permease
LQLLALLYAVGLAGIGLSPTLPVYLAAWVVLGLGMGTGLYDAVFATLGRMYGHGARGPITNLTLFGGFASTICWPLSAYLIGAAGWRGACLIYSALHLCLSLPLQVAVALPGHSCRRMITGAKHERPCQKRSPAAGREGSPDSKCSIRGFQPMTRVYGLLNL